MEYTPSSPPHTNCSDPQFTATDSPLQLPWALTAALDTIHSFSIRDNNTSNTNNTTIIPATMLAVTPALDDSMISTSEETVTAPPPRRNLTEAFEELFDDTDDAATGSMLSPRMVTPKPENTDCLISPTGVTELEVPVESWPGLDLHPILQKELSQALVDRVSFYAIIHDINKECTAMAANDPVQTKSHNTNPIQSPALVAAVKGLPTEASPWDNDNVAKSACIDEEQWLLSTISERSSQEIRSCPETFSQAMGEKEYENPVSSIAGGSRTQLWKPSRSWWEAKSGKNPWIEPTSHNKRWRYLWPLIHYHKFLAKCIKKLKRNGVDVKQTVSPVAVFLREEVCAVSDHLAAVSLFGSDEWMECLQLFEGWTDTHPESEQHLRAMVSDLKLRALLEPGDVDSPLLRNQIDEQYLRTMAAARLEMRDKTEVTRSTKAKRPTPARDVPASSHGHPPMYPRPQGSPPQQSVPKQVPAEFSAEAGMRRPRYGYPPPNGNWGYHHGYDQQPPPGYEQPPPPQGQPFNGDNSSVQSGLSLDSYHQHYPNYSMYPPGYYQAGPSPQFPNPSDQSQSTTGYEHTLVFDQTHGWIDPAMAYALHQQAESAGYYVARPPPSPAMAYTPDDSTGSWQGHANYASNEQTPYKYDPNIQQPQQHSPYWGHLDRATIDMGLATPAKASPSTPRRRKGKSEDKRDDQEGEAEKSESTVDCEEKENGFAANAQPLLLRHNQYYGYGPYAGAPEGGYGPPSPATQFMMSPQAGFAFNYGYGFSSPHRNSTSARSTPRSSKKTLMLDSPPAATNTTMAPSSPVRKVAADRESPSTVDTTTETTSIEEAAAA